MIIDIHSYCNARCTMCPYARYSKRQTQGRMGWRLYAEIIEQFSRIAREHGFRGMVTYCYMGEPFLADDLARYVSFAQDRQVGVYLNTNAAAMTPQKVDSLLATGFAGKVHVSFHGITPAVYERITGLDYETTLGNVRYLLEHYDAKRICIRGVDDNWPSGEYERWLEFWRPYGAQLEYLPPISRCGSVGRLLPKKRRDKGRARLHGCRGNHPLLEMVILFDGRAVMCCQDMGREVIWGDVGVEGILGVWNGKVRREAIGRLYSGAASTDQFLCTRCEEALGPVGAALSLIEHGFGKFRTRERLAGSTLAVH